MIRYMLSLTIAFIFTILFSACSGDGGGDNTSSNGIPDTPISNETAITDNNSSTVTTPPSTTIPTPPAVPVL